MEACAAHGDTPRVQTRQSPQACVRRSGRHGHRSPALTTEHGRIRLILLVTAHTKTFSDGKARNSSYTGARGLRSVESAPRVRDVETSELATGLLRRKWDSLNQAYREARAVDTRIARQRSAPRIRHGSNLPLRAFIRLRERKVLRLAFVRGERRRSADSETVRGVRTGNCAQPVRRDQIPRRCVECSAGGRYLIGTRYNGPGSAIELLNERGRPFDTVRLSTDRNASLLRDAVNTAESAGELRCGNKSPHCSVVMSNKGMLLRIGTIRSAESQCTVVRATDRIAVRRSGARNRVKRRAPRVRNLADRLTHPVQSDCRPRGNSRHCGSRSPTSAHGAHEQLESERHRRRSSHTCTRPPPGKGRLVTRWPRGPTAGAFPPRCAAARR